MIEETFQIKVPGSTSNLGAGFDCFGLALQVYLTVTVTATMDVGDRVTRISVLGTEREGISGDEDNLILTTARETAATFGRELPSINVIIENDIPLGRGLGSSAAAIVAGVAIGARICEHELTKEELVARAAEIEGHADNVAASVWGSRVICYQESGGEFRAMKLPWPAHIRVIVVSPDVPLATKEARAILPPTLPREAAVFNLQRTALLTAALDHGADNAIWEAMRDEIHQPFRAGMVPGLKAALALPRQEGLLGIAISGAGPSVVALARDRFEDISQAIAVTFSDAGIETKVRALKVDDVGIQITN